MCQYRARETANSVELNTGLFWSRLVHLLPGFTKISSLAEGRALSTAIYTHPYAMCINCCYFRNSQREEGRAPSGAGGVNIWILSRATTVSIYPSVTGAIKDAARRYEFLIAAGQFRNHCGAEEVIAYEVDQWSSLVIFCNRREFPEGWSTVTEFKSWGSVRWNSLPKIYSGKPLF